MQKKRFREISLEDKSKIRQERRIFFWTLPGVLVTRQNYRFWRGLVISPQADDGRSGEQKKEACVNKTLYWIILILGLFFTLGTVVTVLSHTAQIANKITLGSIPFVFVGIILDFVTNPAGWLGIILLIWSHFIKKKIAKQKK